MNLKEIFQNMSFKNKPDFSVNGIAQLARSDAPATGVKMQLPNIQVNHDGSLMDQQQADFLQKQREANGSIRGKLTNALFGEQKYPEFIQTGVNDDGTILTGVSESPRNGGFLNDLNSGMNENYNNGFDLNNLVNNQTPDGRNKGFAYRFGEGLGTLARNISGTLGDAYVAGDQGLSTALTRQNTRAGNQLYRKYLDSQGVDTSTIPGLISDKAFTNYAIANYRNSSLGLRQSLGLMSDNTKRANLISTMLNSGMITPQEAMLNMSSYGINMNDLQKSNQTKNADVNEFLAPHKAKAYDTGAMTGMMNAQTNQGRLNLQEQLLPYQQKSLDAGANQKNQKANDSISAVKAVENQLNNFEKTFKVMPSKTNAMTGGQIRKLTGTLTPGEANFNAQRTLLFNKIARDLGGEKGVLSDQDIKRIENSLPTLMDSYEQKQAKMKAVYDLLNHRKAQFYYSENTQGNNDPLGLGI